jgi:uncharacterized protein
MFVIVFARDKPGRSELRAQTKLAHKTHLDAGAPSLKVLQSGPLLSPEGVEQGSLLVLEADAAGTVEAFVRRDPYVEAGLFASFEIHPWLWRRGNPYLDETERRTQP